MQSHSSTRPGQDHDLGRQFRNTGHLLAAGYPIHEQRATAEVLVHQVLQFRPRDCRGDPCLAKIRDPLPKCGVRYQRGKSDELFGRQCGLEIAVGSFQSRPVHSNRRSPFLGSPQQGRCVIQYDLRWSRPLPRRIGPLPVKSVEASETTEAAE